MTFHGQARLDPTALNDDLNNLTTTRLAYATQRASSFAVVVLLISAALFCCVCAIKLEYYDDPNVLSWPFTFLPLMLGTAFASTSLAYSVFASCPYVKLCLQRRSTRVGRDLNPSMIADILPQISISVLAFFDLLLFLTTEASLCRYLATTGQSGLVFFCVSATLASLPLIAFGVMCRYPQCFAIGAFGLDVLITSSMLLWWHNSQQFPANYLLFPSVIMIFMVTLESYIQCRKNDPILFEDERLFLMTKVMCLCILLFVTITTSLQITVPIFSTNSFYYRDRYLPMGCLYSLCLVVYAVCHWKAVCKEYDYGLLFQRNIDGSLQDTIRNGIAGQVLRRVCENVYVEVTESSRNISAPTHTHTNAHTHTNTHPNTHTNAHTNAHTDTNTHTNAHTNAHTHTNTHTQNANTHTQNINTHTHTRDDTLENVPPEIPQAGTGTTHKDHE